MPGEHKPQKAAGTRVVQQLPCRIADGRCSGCNTDLILWTARIELGEDPPICCPHCGRVFRTDTITVPIWQCGACGTEVLEPLTQQYCTGCNAKLVPPEGLAT